MKITIAGWPGAGATTLALILSKTLKLKYVGGTRIFRKLGENLNFNDTGKDRINADKYLEKHFGSIYDKFIGKLLLDNQFDNILVESDIAGFIYKKDYEFFSIFLTTDYQERLKRLRVDGRSADIAVLKQREEENAKFYKILHGIDWFSKNQINDSYDFVIDNSSKTIAQEMKETYLALFNNKLIDNSTFEILTIDSEKQEEEFWQNGKEFYKKFLLENNLIMTEKDIVSLIKNFFKNELNDLPQDIQTALDAI